MRGTLFIWITLLFCTSSQAQPVLPKSVQDDKEKIMGEAYWEKWNPELQKQIDRDIEKYRKADGKLTLKELSQDAEVKIEQISHDFQFGAHIFNFDQLGADELNGKYKELYGTLFNSATIAF